MVTRKNSDSRTAAILGLLAVGGAFTAAFLFAQRPKKRQGKESIVESNNGGASQSRPAIVPILRPVPSEKGDAEPNEEQPNEEYGMFLDEYCTDFVLREPPLDSDASELPQTKAMASIVNKAVATDEDIDPFPLVDAWLEEIGQNNCKLPVKTSVRMASMYIYMASLFALLAVDQGGIVLGIDRDAEGMDDPELLAQAIDGAILAQAHQMGLAEYDASTIPELVPDVPDAIEDLPTVDLATSPKISTMSPTQFVGSSQPAIVMVEGNKLSDSLEFRLFDEKNSIESYPTVSLVDDAVALSFVPKIGTWLVQMRLKGSNKPWESAPMPIVVSPAKYGIATK